MSDEKSEADTKPEETKAGNGAPPAAPPDPVAEWKAKADEYLELARRAKADFINYQDRVRRDKADWNRQALEGFVRELRPKLPVRGRADRVVLYERDAKGGWRARQTFALF